VLDGLKPAFEEYSAVQFVTTRLPRATKDVIVSKYNSLGDGRFYDPESGKSFAFDPLNLEASDVQPHTVDGSELVTSLSKAVQSYVEEHFPSLAASGVYPADGGDVAIAIVGNKYNPSNYWNGKWRSSYTFSPSSKGLKGTIQVDVHYYEDGNVRLATAKDVQVEPKGASASDVVKAIAAAEKTYQEELNKAFSGLSEGAFKNLRRQLPVTRQKIEWEKVSTYRTYKPGQSAK